jgi:hypothetical protein
MTDYQGIVVYAAGKIEKNGWRHQLFPIADDYDYSRGNGAAPLWPEEMPIADLPGAVYVGPHFLSDDHGCFHGPNSHGVAAGDAACGGVYPGMSRPDVAKRCLSAIEQATHVFAWIDDSTAYGTLVELGYARALGKRVHLYMSEKCADVQDMWFAMQITTTSGMAPDVRTAWDDFVVRLPLTQ